jgi:DNA-binding CsgD family transcriptional regulator
MTNIERARELAEAIDPSLTRHELLGLREELVAILVSAPSEHEVPSHPRLSRREGEVLRMILEGKRLKEIGAILDISVKTVTTHRSRLLRKLNLEDNLGLFRYGVRSGMISV